MANPKKVNAYKVAFYENKGQHRARITASNGEIVFPPEGYSKKSDLVHALRITHKSLGKFLKDLDKK